ncbi:MAG: MarR family transcriptional regulator [Bacteroidales bacterium]|nr:MarR family transcriptional regulator [Bacteroidales bacterium]
MEKCDSKYCSCLYYSANALSRIMTKMADETFAVTGLSSSYAFLLMTVNDKPGIQPNEISTIMQLTPSTITRLIEKMETRGLLYREHSGRITEVYPTQSSLDLDYKIKEAWKNLYQKYSNILGKEKGDELAALIHDATRKLE